MTEEKSIVNNESKRRSLRKFDLEGKTGAWNNGMKIEIDKIQQTCSTSPACRERDALKL